MKKNICFEEFKKILAYDKEGQIWLKQFLKEFSKAYTSSKAESVIRNINRIIADAEKKSIQKRSGTKMFNEWLSQAIHDFADMMTSGLAKKEMSGKHGGSGYVVGSFEMFAVGNELRARFDNLSDAIRYASSLRAVIPYTITIDCGGGVWVKY